MRPFRRARMLCLRKASLRGMCRQGESLAIRIVHPAVRHHHLVRIGAVVELQGNARSLGLQLLSAMTRCQSVAHLAYLLLLLLLLPPTGCLHSAEEKHVRPGGEKEAGR